MEHKGDIPQNTEIVTIKRPGKKLSGGLFVGLIAALLIIAVYTVVNFTQFLNEQLFLERQTHLLEITTKVSEIIDVVVDSTWGDVQTCEELMEDFGNVSEAELSQNLSHIVQYVDSGGKYQPTIFAFDQTATFYASNGERGHWSDTSVFLETAPDEQVIVSSLPYMNVNDSYFVFIQRIDRDISLIGTDKKITHIGIAFAIDTLSEAFSISGFEGSTYTYLVNSEGRRLYKDTDLHDFIDGYNILTAMEEYKFINGGSIEELKSAVGSENKACLEFKYDDSNYYVGTSLIPSIGWEVMLFVPTDVLGANTDALIARTSQYFLLIGAIFIILIFITLYNILSSRNDKILVEQQRESNKLLAKSAAEANLASRAKSEFLSRMSHDIRTPINGIMGMTEIAVKHIDDKERTVDCLHKIDTASHHLLSLVNDVLDMSSIESGKTMLSFEPIDLRAVLSNCSSIICGQIIDRQVEFITEFEGLTHTALLGDELRLRQIFINILGNAVKYTPDGGKITFTATEIKSTDKKATFRFVVEDTGMGMSEKYLTHIFEPFSQEHNDSRTTYKGTGLGMAITKQFVDLMGGTIAVESKLHEGSRFTIELPLDIYEERIIKDIKEKQIADLTGMKVLLVEDNDLNMEIAKCILEEAHITVTEATNGKEAVDVFSDNPPGSFDAILMDVMMPVMDGMAATKAIRSLPREDAAKIPILAMTANAYEQDRKMTRESGMDAHLSKPINDSALFSTLSYYYKREG